jgi:hypothetical protein
VTAGWSALERPSAEGGIDSVQRIVLGRPVVSTTDAGARELGVRYWAELEQYSRGLVRVRDRAGEITLVLAGMVTLFRFGAGHIRVNDTVVECRFPILGGVLVARKGGSLAIAQRSGTVHELDVSVTGYHPRLAAGSLRHVRKFVYSTVQRPLHLAVSRRFLDRIARRRP